MICCTIFTIYCITQAIKEIIQEEQNDSNPNS